MKGKFVIALLPAVLFSISSCQHKVGNVSIKTEHDSVSYIIGHNIGTNLGDSPMTEVNVAAIAKGLQDALDEKDLFMDLTAANMFVSQYMQSLEESVGENTLVEGIEFLEENKKRKGVITTESGLQYEILVEADGPKPTEENTVSVHYHGTLIDGTVFDSSVDRGEPAQFGVTQVIAG